MNKTIRYIEYICIIFLLILGLFVSSIGVTLCRYQVSDQKDITFRIRGAGEFYITDNDEEWTMDISSQTLNYHFRIKNTENEVYPEITHSFHVRLNMPNNLKVQLIAFDLSGNEWIYEGIYNQDTNEYYFIDNDKEALFELEGNKQSYIDFRIDVQGVNDAFISEIIIYDATYDIEKRKQDTISQSYPLEITSNYLSENEDITVVMKDSINITLTSNMGANSKVTVTGNDKVTATVNNKTNLAITLEPNIENKVNLTVTSSSSQDETVIVTWYIYDNDGNVKKTLKAKFLVRGTAVSADTEIPDITMNYVDNQKTFNKYTPIEFTVSSDIDTSIEIRESLFSKNMRYSLNNGKTWYVLSYEDSINLSLKASIKQKVMIDYRYSDMDWNEQVYNIYAYYKDKELNKLQFNKEIADIEVLKVTSSSMGAINKNDISFVLNTKDIEVYLEYLNNETYETLNKDKYFKWEISDDAKYDITPLDNIDIPKGVYRIRLVQKYNDTLIKEEYLYFFAIDTE